MEIAIVGSGRVGTALGILWQAAEHNVVAAAGSERTERRVREHLPETEFLPSAEAAARGEVVVIGVPDDAIEAVCREIVGSVGAEQTVLHLSGSVSLGALAHPRMRHGEVRIVDLLVTVEEEIEVDRARSEPLRANAAEFGLDTL